MTAMFRGSSKYQYRHVPGDLLAAWSVATALSGMPSTLWAVWTGTDPWQALRAAGSMLVPADTALPLLVMSAVAVHCTVSLLWATLLVLLVPVRYIVPGSLIAAALIGVFNLRIIGRLFEGVHALPFWPQMADHLLWGGLMGTVLKIRERGRARSRAQRLNQPHKGP